MSTAKKCDGLTVSSQRHQWKCFVVLRVEQSNEVCHRAIFKLRQHYIWHQSCAIKIKRW